MKGLSNWLRIALGVVAFGLLLLIVDVRAVVSSLQDIRAVDICYLLLLSVMLVLVSVIKWRLFLRRLGMNASVLHLFRLYLVGYFVNLLMPSSLGGDVVRSLYVGKGVDKVKAVSATLLERYTGFIAMVLMSLVAVWWAPQVTGQIRLLTVIVGAAAFCLTLALLSGRFAQTSKLLKLPERVHGKVVRLEEGLQWGLSDKGLLLRAGGLSILFHLLTIVNTAVVGHAVGWEEIPWGDLFVVVPLILLIGAVPVSPQGLGIQEGAFVFFLSGVGASSGQAMAIALVLRAKSYLLAAVGGLLWFGLSRSVSDSSKADHLSKGQAPGPY